MEGLNLYDLSNYDKVHNLVSVKIMDFYGKYPDFLNDISKKERCLLIEIISNAISTSAMELVCSDYASEADNLRQDIEPLIRTMYFDCLIDSEYYNEKTIPLFENKFKEFIIKALEKSSLLNSEEFRRIYNNIKNCTYIVHVI